MDSAIEEEQNLQEKEAKSEFDPSDLAWYILLFIGVVGVGFIVVERLFF